MSISEEEAVEARITGKYDYRRGRHQCPFPAGTPEHRFWSQGHDDEKAREGYRRWAEEAGYVDVQAANRQREELDNGI